MRRSEWVLVSLLVLAFTPALLALVRVWASVEYYSHGFLVPVVAGWIATREGALRRGLAVVRDRTGVWAIVAALGLHLLGIAAGSAPLEGLALVLALAGGLAWRYGRARLRRFTLPLALLLLAVPLPPDWLGPLILRLQLVVSRAAVPVLAWLSSPVSREGNVLVLIPSGETLFVAEACSGITSIVTLVPLALVLAALTLRSAWGRAALLAAVVPVALLCNLLRVVLTVRAAQALGVERATSSALHEAAGLLTFALACGMLIALGAWLARWLERRGRAGAAP